MPLGGNGSGNSGAGNAPKQPSSGVGGKSNGKGKTNNKLPMILIYAAYAGCGASIAWFGAMNIAPYKALLDGAGAEMIRNGFVSFILWLPLIGGIVKSMGVGIAWLLGLFVWGLIQTIEVLPGVLWRHEGFLKSVTGASDRTGHTTVRQGEGMFVNSAKQRLNRFVNSFLRNMWLYSILAYLVDFAICVWYYPLIPGATWDKTAMLLMLGQWKRVDMGNLWGVFATLFAVEIIVHVFITVWTLHQIFKQSSKTAQ
jgi:hypothetical protein